MTIDEAIEKVKKEYELAKVRKWLYNPLGYALYSVWREADLKQKTETDLSFKCGSCKYAKPIQGSKRGIFGTTVECTNKEHIDKYCYRHKTSKLKQRTCKACKSYEPVY